MPVQRRGPAPCAGAGLALAGLLALAAAAARVEALPAAAVSAAPDTVRLFAGRLRRDGPGAQATGRADLAFVLRDNAAGGSFATRALLGQVSVTVSDAGAFAAALAIRGCTRRAPGVLVCIDARRDVVLELKTIQAAPLVYAAVLRARHLPAGVTGRTRPGGPVTLAVHQQGGNDPADLVAGCRDAGRTGLVCRATPGPNVVVIMTDDQRWDTLPYMPTVESRLVGGGITFTNAFVPTPICCPSRASTLTGLYAHHHGVLQIGPPSGGAPAFVGPDASTIATWLHDAGYRTGLFGKYMNSYPALGPPERASWYVPPGWDRWDAFAIPAYYGYDLVHEDGTATSYGAAPADYSTDVLARRALDFITASVAARVPFFVYFAPFGPHVDVPSFLPLVAPRHLGLFASVAPFRPASWDEADVSDKPARIRALPALGGSLGEVYVDVLRVQQLEALRAEDEAVGAILDLLQQSGQEANTVVVFTSDNGYLWGEHRLYGKEAPYDESLRIPLVIRHPPTVLAPREEARFVLNIDLAPTLAALAGVMPPTPVDGRSLVPLLRNEPTDWRTDFLLEQWALGGVLDWVGVRTEAWKYVEYATRETELYDLVNDPSELENRGADPGYRGIAAVLRERLAELTTPTSP